MVISTFRIIILVTHMHQILILTYFTSPDQSKSIHVSNNEIIPLEGNLQIKVYSKEDGFRYFL